MNTDETDPILRGLDDLAALTDGVPVGDRMAGINRRARSNRRRKVAAGAAALAVVAAGTLGAVRLLPEESEPRPVIDPADPTQVDGLTIDLAVEQVGPTELSVTYRVRGTASAWSSPDDHQPMDFSGPRYTRVLLDGEEVSGSDGGDIECRAGAPEVPFDETWKAGKASALPPVRVPAAGTYTVTVDAPYCGPDGELVANEASETVTVE